MKRAFGSSFILPTSSFQFGAGDEIRTRDPQLGRLMLYQLSYTRSTWCRGQDSNLRRALARRVYSPVPLTTRPPLLTPVKWLLEPAKGLEPPTL